MSDAAETTTAPAGAYSSALDTAVAEPPAVADQPPSPTIIDVPPALATPLALPARRSRRQRLRRVVLAPLVFLRYLLRKVLYVIVRVIRAAWRHPIVTLLFLVGAAVGYQGYNEYVKEDPPPPVRPVFDITAAIPPAPAVQSYLAAQKAYDGAAMWNEFSERTKTGFLSQGVTLQTYQQRAENLRSSGISYSDGTYIGGVVGEHGVDFYFYLIRVTSGAGQVLDIYQVFYVDHDDGTILNMEEPQFLEE